MVLVDIANGKQRHVPYRDSKLTFLLQVIILLILDLYSEFQLSATTANKSEDV